MGVTTTMTVEAVFSALDYESLILADAPVAYWRFGDTVGSSTVSDSSGNGYTGTVVGGVTLGQAGAIADGDTAALFDAVDGAVTTAAGAGINALAGDFSVEFWLKPTHDAATDYRLVVAHSRTSARSLEVYFRPSDKCDLYVNGGFLDLLSPVLTIGAWNHVVFARIGSDVSAYVNAGTPTTASYASALTNISGPTIGVDIGSYAIVGTNPLDSTLDDMAIYDYGLTSTQVTEHYRLGAAIWTDITSDLLLDRGFSFRYGMAGGGPTDRLGSTGWARFSLDNSTSNSAGLLGYYSPLNTNCRAGFTFGIPIRISFSYGGTTYYKWRGKLTEIAPVAGQYRERVTRCLAVDWMDEPASYFVRDVDLQANKRSDEVFSEIVSVIPKAPAAQSIGTGRDTYTYALDDIGRGNHPSAASVMQALVMTELGYAFVKGDTTQGGTLVFENRHTRPLNTTTLATLDETMMDIDVPTTLDQIYNRVEVTTHPKRVDAAATTVLYSLESTPILQPSETVTIWGDYRDPASEAIRTGGTAMVSPVATTDYLFNSSADGTGSDMTSSLTVTATFFAASVKFELTNGASSEGYVTLLQCRGKGLYDYAPEISLSEDTAAQTAQGLRSLDIDMPYQDSRIAGQGAADWIMGLYSVAQKQINSVRFYANDTAALMTAALAGEISSRVKFGETVTGILTSQSGWFINGVEFNVQPAASGQDIWCTWTLAPSDGVQAWILETVGYSELESTTILGFL